MPNRLKQLYQQMADLTAPECEKNCLRPHSCCAPEYCQMAEEWAKTKGIILTQTGHPTLKFMSPTGCVVEPYLRPLCTLHTCAVNSHGFKPKDPEWTKKYFELRDLIENAEWS